MPANCVFGDCLKYNIDTSCYTVDMGGIRYYCDKHWGHVNFYFNEIVSACAKEILGCERNRLAEWYNDEQNIFTVKHHDKFWDLCDSHSSTYDKLVNIEINLGYFED